MINKAGIASGLLWLGLASCTSVQASGLLSISGQNFIDREGRIVVLHGINASSQSKRPPFITFSRGPGELARLPKWGFNTVRLQLVWEALEPTPGSYDLGYLDQISSLVVEASRLGLYVVLDMHQDGYSRFVGSGCGSGFPEWAVPKDLKRNPRSVPKCGAWGIKMAISKRMMTAFHRFFDDRDGLRTAYLKAWELLAIRFKGEPAVIGYDLINEPWAEERKELAPFYEDLARVIHAQDPDAFLFLEPTMNATTSGMKKTSIPKPRYNNVIYAPHFYNPLVAIFGTWKKSFGVLDSYAIHLHQKGAREWNVPLFLGEFGPTGHTRHADRYLLHLNQLFLTELTSGAQWTYSPDWTDTAKDGWNGEDFSIVNEKGELRSNVSLLPHVQRLSGELESQTLEQDPRTRILTYTLKWRDRGRGAHVPTEIYLPNDPYFGSPWEMRDQSAALKCAYDRTIALYRCASTEAGVQSLQLVQRTVPVSP